MVTKPPASAISNLLLLPSITSFLIISTFSAVVNSQNDTSYDNCSPFRCGNLTFSFPFSSSLTSGHCGVPDYQISCDPSSDIPSLLFSGRLYRVKNFFTDDRLITVVDTQLVRELSSGSCGSLYNLSATDTSTGSLTLPPGTVNFTFFKCADGLSLPEEFTDNLVGNLSCNDGHEVFLWSNGNKSVKPSFDPVVTPSGCDLVLVPVSSVSYLFPNGSDGDYRLKIIDPINKGFPLEWPKFDKCDRCQNRGGRCGYEGGSKEIICFCKGGSCDSVKDGKSKLLLIIGVATGSCSVVLVAVLLLVFRKKILSFFQKFHSEKDGKIEDGLNVEQFIKTYRSTLLSNYSYNDVKKMTYGFKEKLGAGGYGNVYKGKFPDGRLVAVKLLDKTGNLSNSFINEVATIGRIHHVNIINLLGFCCDGSTRALIYEYMPNGSLGDLLSKQKANHLELERLLEIALGVAHAIEYLHNGCERQILHLDIKPQNVLLDQDFNPKISDFGLAKAHSRNKSVVTMTGARGTIGYIAPEIFLRNLGNPSHKSDVYSYGMLLLEMVGGRKLIKASTNSSNTTETYFPDWIYDKFIQEDHFQEEEKEDCLARKMVLVGLWCIQINPQERPSMTRVVEMLSGSVEAIEVAPKPLFLSPPPSQIENERTSIDSNTSDLPLTCSSHEMYYTT